MVIYAAFLNFFEVKLKKTAHYRRATQSGGEETTLSAALDLAHDEYPSRAYPTFRYKAGTDAIVARHVTVQGMQFLHIVTFEAGAGAAVIETVMRTGVNEEPAPAAKEYIQSQLYLLCNADEVIFTSHNSPLRDGAVSHLVNQLLATFSTEDTPPAFILTAIVDEARIRELMREGIEEIDLDVGGYRPTLEYIANGRTIVDGGLFSMLKSLFTNDVTAEDRAAAEKIMARLTLRPGRDWDDLGVKTLLADAATRLLDDEDEDGFTIVTKSGLRITRNTIRVSESINIRGNRRILDVDEVQDALVHAFDNFEHLGITET